MFIKIGKLVKQEISFKIGKFIQVENLEVCKVKKIGKFIKVGNLNKSWKFE